jgi:phosphatidylglycerophosphate synthase
MKKQKYDFKAASAYHKEWSTYVFDIIGRPLSKFVVKFTNITPNQVSIASFVLAIIGGLYFLKGDYKSILIGAIFAFFYNILDMMDGRIARAKKTGSLLGKWLDAMIDFVVFPYLIFTLALGIGTYMAAVIGMLAIMSYQTHYLIVHFYKSEIVGSKKLMNIPGKYEWLRSAYGSNFFYLFLLIAAIINLPMTVLLFWATFGNLYWVMIMFIQYRNLKQK